MEIASASDVLTGLLGTIVDRAADILELVGAVAAGLSLGLFLMLLSAVCPYLFFRWRGWL